MILDQLIQAMVTITGIALSFAYFPQAWRVWKLKSAEDISLLSVVLFVIGTTTWLSYGFYRNDPVIIASFLFGVIGSCLLLILTLFFRRKKVKSDPTGL